MKRLPILLSLFFICLLLLGGLLSSCTGQKDLILKGRMGSNGVEKVEFVTEDRDTPNTYQEAKPYVREGQTVYIMLEDYNPFLYRANDLSQTQALPTDPGDLTSPFLNLNPRGETSGEQEVVVANRDNFDFGTESLLQADTNLRQKLNEFEEALLAYRHVYHSVAKIRETILSPSFNNARDRDALLSQVYAAQNLETGADGETLNTIARTRKQSVTQSFASLQTAYEEYKREYRAYLAKTTDSLDMRMRIDSLLTENFQKSVDQFENFQSPDEQQIYEELWVLLLELKKASFVYYSGGIQADEDLVKLHLEIEQRSPDGEFQAFDSVKRKVYVRGGWQARGSEGIAGAYYFGANNEYINQEGEITAVPGDIPRPMLTTLLHFNYRSGRSITGGLHLGTGFTIEDEPQLHLLTGGSLVLGRENNWYINLGVALGRMTILETGKKVGSHLPSPDATVPTYKVWRPGLQVGISYRFIQNN